MEYHSTDTLKALFPSQSRRVVLTSLFGPRGRSSSKSALARRAGLTQRAISVEVDSLERCGLIRVEALGTAHVIRPNDAHPSVRALRGLLARTEASAAPAETTGPARRSLVALGAPLPDPPSPEPPDAPAALVDALRAARADAEVLRVLPAVVARLAHDIDWPRVVDLARVAKLKAELGFVLDLAADLAGLPWLRDLAAPLRDGRRRVPRWLPDAAGESERALAERHPSAVGDRWGFRVNLGEAAFRAALLAAPPSAPRRAGEPGPEVRGALEDALRALDASGEGPAEVTVLGDAAFALRHGDPPALPSLDIFPAPADGARAAMAATVERHPFLASLGPAASLASAPFRWLDRRVPCPVPGLTRLRVLLPEAHDWAILRAATALATDLDAVEALHRLEPLRLGVLVSRYLEAIGDSAEAEARLRPGFLAIVERLHGPRGRDRVLAGLAPGGSLGGVAPAGAAV
jgi:hypothetical protein